jgi:hypothetical protein
MPPADGSREVEVLRWPRYDAGTLTARAAAAVLHLNNAPPPERKALMVINRRRAATARSFTACAIA